VQLVHHLDHLCRSCCLFIDVVLICLFFFPSVTGGAFDAEISFPFLLVAVHFVVYSDLL